MTSSYFVTNMKFMVTSTHCLIWFINRILSIEEFTVICWKIKKGKEMLFLEPIPNWAMWHRFELYLFDFSWCFIFRQFIFHWYIFNIVYTKNLKFLDLPQGREEIEVKRLKKERKRWDFQLWMKHWSKVDVF